MATGQTIKQTEGGQIDRQKNRKKVPLIKSNNEATKRVKNEV